METRKATIIPFLDLQPLEQLLGARCPTKGEVFRFFFFSSLYPQSLCWWCSEGSCWRCAIILDGPLWSKIGKKNTDKIAIQSFTVPRAREWAKWASERTSERSGGREQSEQSGASERVSGASKWANGWASGPVLQSVFIVTGVNSMPHPSKVARAWKLKVTKKGNKRSEIHRGGGITLFFCIRNLFIKTEAGFFAKN